MTRVIEFKEREYTFQDKIKNKKYRLQFLPKSIEDLSKSKNLHLKIKV